MKGSLSSDFFELLLCRNPRAHEFKLSSNWTLTENPLLYTRVYEVEEDWNWLQVKRWGREGGGQASAQLMYDVARARIMMCWPPPPWPKLMDHPAEVDKETSPQTDGERIFSRWHQQQQEPWLSVSNHRKCTRLVEHNNWPRSVLSDYSFSAIPHPHTADRQTNSRVPNFQ